MIDLSKFEKIEGGFIEALQIMSKGESVFSSLQTRYVLDATRMLFYISEGRLTQSLKSYSMLSQMDWYIPKPFDVRSTLVNNPNKWVAAYLGQECPHWFKIGFDLQAMSVVKALYSFDGDVDDKTMSVEFVEDVELEEILDLCIDIEDVPQSEKDMLEQPWKTERIIYISPKLQEYFNKKYPHLTENDIEAILLSVEKKHEDEPYLPVGSKPYLFTMFPYTYKLEENIASLYGVNPAIPHLYDDEGVLFKKEKIEKG